MMEFNKLYNEDTLKILKSLPNECLDMVYGDPDYNADINYNGSTYTQNGRIISRGIVSWQQSVSAF